MRHAQSVGLPRAGCGRRIWNLHLHGLCRRARLAAHGRKPQAESRALTTYEVREDPDDLPIICATLAEAERRGRRRAASLGIEILIYEMHPERGERFIGTI
jgi:hypothetical protein